MKRFRRGASLIEAILYVVVATAVVIGGIVFFHSASESSRVDSAVRSIVSIQSGVRSLYQGNSRFPEEGSDLAHAVVVGGSVPAARIGVDGTLVNEWGGDISVLAFGTGFIVDYGNVPREACIRLAPYTMQGVGMAGYGIAAISVGGVAADQNGDGQVTPEEALLACSGGGSEAALRELLVAAPAYASMLPAGGEQAQSSGLNLRWVFVPDPASKLDPFVVEDLLNNGVTPPPVEVSRRVEDESGECPAGQVGSASRSREIVVWSDGSEVPTAWSEWDLSGCAVVQVSSRTETESGACPVDMTGSAVRSRDIAIMSDGSEVVGAWGSWDTSSCTPIRALVETRTYKSEELVACGYGSRLARRYSQAKELYTTGEIVAKPRQHVGDGACATYDSKTYGTVDIRVYSDCPVFGQQSYLLQRYLVYNSNDVRYNGQVGSAGCGYH